MYKSIIRLMGIFLLAYSTTLIPYYASFTISYFGSVVGLSTENYIFIIIGPILISIFISIFLIVKAGFVSSLLFGGSEEKQISINKELFVNAAFFKGAVKVLCIFLLFTAAGHFVYGITYFATIEKMVKDPSFIDPRGLGNLLASIIECVFVVVIFKIRWFKDKT